MLDAGAIPDDDVDTDLDGQGDQGDQGTDVIQSLLDYGRKKYGLSGGGDQQQAGNVPPVPAGPGGDQQQPNPFGTRTPKVPFGKRVGAIDDDSETTQSFEDGGAVEDDDLTTGAIPDGQPDTASNVGNRQINDMADSAASDVGSKVRNLLPSAEQNAPDRASQVGQQQINDSADGMAADVGAALKGGAQAVGSAVKQGWQALNEKPEGPNPLGAGGTFDPSTAGANLKRIMGYLTGDAAHSGEIAAAEKAVDPNNEMSAGQRRTAAIEQATQTGGPEAGWRLTQGSRQQYEGLRHSAAAVLDGSKDKPGDAQQAVALANQAFDNLPDGTDVHFKAVKDGVTATVINGTKVTTQVTLSPDQFRQFLTAKQGQFDNILNNNVGVTLQQITKGNSAFTGAIGQVTQGGGGGLTMGNPVNPNTSTQAPRSDAQQQPAQAGGGDDPLSFFKRSENTPGRAALEKIASQRFPWVSQSEQKAEWIAEHLDTVQKLDSSERAASEKGTLATERAKIAAGGKKDVANINQEGANSRNDKRVSAYRDNNAAKINAQLQRAAQQSNDANVRAKVGLIGRALTNSPGMSMDDLGKQTKQHGFDLDQFLSSQGIKPVQSGMQPSAGQQQPAGKPSVKPGDVLKGYRFKGGDPKDQANWEPE